MIRRRPQFAATMLPAPDSFDEFVARLKARDGAAAREVFERFACRLLGLARRQFDGPLRHKVDPEDVVQSTFKSFFRRHDDGRLEVVNWDSLWGLLALITVRKCADRVAYHKAERRDVGREAARPDTLEAGPWEAAIDREPTPDEAAELGELVRELTAELDASDRPILELSLQGYSTQEISEQLGRPERTVRRLRERIRGRLERL